MSTPRTSSRRIPGASISRIPILDVQPVAEGGRFPARTSVGEFFPVSATVFREGHDAYAAEAVLLRPNRTLAQRVPMVETTPGLDRYEAWLTADTPGDWLFRVDAWANPFATWVHDANIKVPAGIDVDLMLAEGVRLFQRAADHRRKLSAADRDLLREVAAVLADAQVSATSRLLRAVSAEVHAVFARSPLRDLLSSSATYPLQVDRPLAARGAWYEIFPRSVGATRDQETGKWTSGTLRTAATDLPRIASMGFDVVYLTPIHPIGTTFRKGRNNTLVAEPGDPGSPYAIGSPDGGHDAIDPQLGTFEDFDFFVAQARELGLEVALDVALQCSPDHPWVSEHPQWFAHRADGSIAYAENPPKKYQDIYPLYFDTDPEGLFTEIRRVLQVWIDHGVTCFRVDNPHTKPLAFWQRLLADVRASHPEVLFLAEAFTRPAMMLTLAKVGFHQSYTYFSWRNTKLELEEYLARVGGYESHWMRPSFWPTTHDILPPYLQQSGVGGFAVRAVLSAIGAPTWGIYSGYELVENVPRPGVEEQIDNEKYEYRPRDWAQADELGIALLLGRLNEIRRSHPALGQLQRIRIHQTDNEHLICFSRHLTAAQSTTGIADIVVAVVNLDPWHTQEGWVHLDLEALGLPTGQVLNASDELTGEQMPWQEKTFVRLVPSVSCAHILSIEGV